MDAFATTLVITLWKNRAFLSSSIIEAGWEEDVEVEKPVIAIFAVTKHKIGYRREIVEIK